MTAHGTMAVREGPILLHPPKRVSQRRLHHKLSPQPRALSQSSFISEVRQSLSMPGSPSFRDEEQADTAGMEQLGAFSSLAGADNDDDMSVFNSNSTATASVGSSASGKRRKRRFLERLRWKRRGGGEHINDAASISSASSTFSWWSQGSRKRRKRKKLKLFRWKKNLRQNDRLVAEFFDGAAIDNDDQSDDDSKSVFSRLSISSSFMGFFLRKTKKRDSENNADANFFGREVGLPCQDLYANDDDGDEVITLGSGLDTASLGSASLDSRSVGSKSSTSSARRLMKRPQKKKRPKTFLDKLLKRRKRKKQDTALRLAVKGEELSESEATVEGAMDLRKEGKTISKSRSVKSLGDTPSSSSEKVISRWDSDDSVAKVSSAPKQPQRQKESAEAPKIKSSQSMQNLAVKDSEFSDEDDNSDSDDSVLSLLSGLLLAWSTEQMENNCSALFNTSIESLGNIEVKSILKSSKNLAFEAKVPHTVAFSTIEVREYERIVGDNPSCTRGPPMSIGWAYILSYCGNVKDYETSEKTHKRSKKEFYFTADQRTKLLTEEWEIPEEELTRARREITYIQYCRAKTSFSSSRAAAREAAFLRKASDRTKMLYLHKNRLLTDRDGKCEEPPGSKISDPAEIPTPQLPEVLRKNISPPPRRAPQPQNAAVANNNSAPKPPPRTRSISESAPRVEAAPSLPVQTNSQRLASKEIKVSNPEQQAALSTNPKHIDAPPSAEESAIDTLVSKMRTTSGNPVKSSPVMEI